MPPFVGTAASQPVFTNWKRKKINMESHLWTLLWITPVSGSLGGIINYYNLDEDLQNMVAATHSNKKRDWLYKLTRSMIIGIGAAFTVPLFLQTISSSLMTDCKDKPQLFFVYAGFCILASVFSRKFLYTVAEKALKTAQKADQKSTLALDKTEELKPLQIKATEKDEDLNSEDEDLDESDMSHLDADLREKVKLDMNNIKKAFQKSKYTYRTTKGIAKQIKSDENVVKIILEEMEDEGLVKRIINTDTNKVLWTLTE
jgi:hypothetical protein